MLVIFLKIVVRVRTVFLGLLERRMVVAGEVVVVVVVVGGKVRKKCQVIGEKEFRGHAKRNIGKYAAYDACPYRWLNHHCKM